jgi:hypothetical protein
MDRRRPTTSHRDVRTSSALKLDARLTLFITLVSTFMVCLVVGDLVGGKVTSFVLFDRE